MATTVTHPNFLTTRLHYFIQNYYKLISRKARHLQGSKLNNSSLCKLKLSNKLRQETYPIIVCFKYIFCPIKTFLFLLQVYKLCNFGFTSIAYFIRCMLISLVYRIYVNGKTRLLRIQLSGMFMIEYLYDSICGKYCVMAHATNFLKTILILTIYHICICMKAQAIR